MAVIPRLASVVPEGRTRQGRYREELQARHYARRTVTTYEQWEMGSAEVNAFLNRLVRAHQPRRLPVVLTPEEDRAVLQRLQGSDALVAGLLYGSGLWLMEALRLRVHDLDFKRHELTVRAAERPSHHGATDSSA
ncbi:MAG: hypothetical protein ACKO28_08660 [Cyanobium sp.]